MREQIEKIFDSRIHKVFGPRPDLASFFLKHERKKVALDNLVEQTRKAEWVLGAKMNTPKFVTMVEHVADLFCRAALGTKELEIMSAAEKRRQSIAPESLVEEFEAELNEENAKVHRGQIIAGGWKPGAKNIPRTRQVPKIIKP